MHRFFDKIRRDLHRGLGNNMTGAVPNQDLNGNAGILFLSVCVVDKSAGNAVGHLVRVCGIDFFKHDFHPFLARSRRSMRSSCGDGSL